MQSKGISNEILYVVVILFLLLVVIAAIYAGGIQLIQEFLKQHLIK